MLFKYPIVPIFKGIIITVIISNLLEIKSSIWGNTLSESIPKMSSCCKFIKSRKLVLSVNSLISPAIVVSNQYINKKKLKSFFKNV